MRGKTLSCTLFPHSSDFPHSTQSEEKGFDNGADSPPLAREILAGGDNATTVQRAIDASILQGFTDSGKGGNLSPPPEWLALWARPMSGLI